MAGGWSAGRVPRRGRRCMTQGTPRPRASVAGSLRQDADLVCTPTLASPAVADGADRRWTTIVLASISRVRIYGPGGQRRPSEWTSTATGSRTSSGAARQRRQVYAYLATGTSGTTFQPAYLTTQTSDWQIVGIGDFNGDGKSDILWSSTSTGAVYVYVANGAPGTASFQPGYLTTQTADWQIVGVGDFDGDGKSDILWRSTSTGAVYVYLATGTSGTTFQPAYLTTQTSEWQIVGIGDFNGDGKSDILWRSTSTGAVYVYVANGSPGHGLLPARLPDDADGRLADRRDRRLRRGREVATSCGAALDGGQVYVYLATGTSGSTFQPAYLTTQTSDWQIVGIGDFNGDGKSDILWRSTSTGTVYVYVANGAPGTASFQPGYLTTQTADWQIIPAEANPRFVRQRRPQHAGPPAAGRLETRAIVLGNACRPRSDTVSRAQGAPGLRRERAAWLPERRRSPRIGSESRRRHQQSVLSRDGLLRPESTARTCWSTSRPRRSCRSSGSATRGFVSAAGSWLQCRISRASSGNTWTTHVLGASISGVMGYVFGAQDYEQNFTDRVHPRDPPRGAPLRRLRAREAIRCPCRGRQ